MGLPASGFRQFFDGSARTGLKHINQNGLLGDPLRLSFFSLLGNGGLWRFDPGQTSGLNADYGTERARLVKAKADLAEMEASQMRGDLLSAPDVKVAWTEIVALMRARLLVLPDKIAPVVHETTSLNQARDVIKKAVHEVLKEIAETDVEIVPHVDGDDSAATVGETNAGSGSTTSRSDRKSVGGQK